MNFFKNFVNSLHPDERAWVFIIAEQVIAQTLLQLRHQGEDATTNLLLRGHGEGRRRFVKETGASDRHDRSPVLLKRNLQPNDCTGDGGIEPPSPAISGLEGLEG